MSQGYKFPPLKWLMSFEAAARHMSFTAAAEELGLSQAAISYQVKCLETMVGAALFERKPRNLRLTDIGHAYLPSVRRAFDELFASTAGLFGNIGQNAISVRVAISFMALCLGPRLNAFKQLYPEIDINFWSSIWANAEDTVDADLDIRFGNGNWPGYEAHRITHDSAILVCNPELATWIASPADAARIPTAQMIHVVGQDDLWRRAMASLSGESVSTTSICVDTSIAAAELACSGVGYALLSGLFAKPYLEAGRLVRPCALELDMSNAHYLLLPVAKKRPSPEVLLFRDWLLGIDWST